MKGGLEEEKYRTELVISKSKQETVSDENVTKKTSSKA